LIKLVSENNKNVRGIMMKKSLRLILLTALLFTLTLAANSAFAMLKVNVMPSGTNSQANIWDSKGPYTWPGNNLELWGNVSYDGAGTLSYTWNFGAGEGFVGPLTVTNRNNIAASHVYAGQGSFVATLTVTDGTDTDSDTVFIDVVPQTLAVRKNLAIQKGLKYLYTSRGTIPASSYGCAMNYWNTYATAGTGLALMAFMNHGHLEINDPDADIYAKVVEEGLNYYFYDFSVQSAATMDNTNFKDSDINGNGKKHAGYTNNMYHVGIAAMTIAATATPNAVVRSCANASIAGRTYKSVLEDVVDYIAYAQQEGTSGYAGGWRYGANYGSSDGSVTQWPALGLGEAQGPPWNIIAPAWVKTRMGYWNNYDQNPSSGGFGYTGPYDWVNVAKTGAGIAGMSYSGTGGNLTNAVNYLNNNWGATGYDYGNKGDHYAMYAVKKGMEFAGLSTVGGHDWQAEYDQWLVDNQNGAGYWPGSVRIDAGQLSTAFGLLVLAPLEACKPLANAGSDQNVGAGVAVSFDGSASTHTCPDTSSIETYEWDFDYDGVNFDVDYTGPTALNLGGYTIPNGTDTQDYIIALKVTDTQGKTGFDTLVVTVDNGNLAPTANPGGPYLGAVGEDITLNGAASFDQNSISGSNPILNPATTSGYDEIVRYQWDIDGDGIFGTEDDSPVEPEGVSAVVNFGPNFIGTQTVGLKVTDSFGKTAAQSTLTTTVAVSNLFPVSYELVSNIYNRVTRKWTVTWKMNLINEGNAAATAVSAVMTPSSIPPGVTVSDANLSWTGAIDPGETQPSSDTFQYTYARGIAGPDLTQITWDIQFTDNLGTQHVVRNIPQ
jgi:hypothetical protein